MPPSRSSLARRRRSSLGLGLTQVKPGNYGITLNSSISPRALSFAPNVTPSTYIEVDDDLSPNDPPHSPTSALFPPTEPAPAPTRRRLPPGKRLSQGYIPRPPNAFMLFRANFVRQKHVPGSIETNHGSLSKIIGNCWRALPLEEKRYWEVEAKKAKAAHRERYPNYRFRPVHNKNKTKDKGGAVTADKRKEKMLPQPEDEERCEVVAQLLLDGMKGEELAAALKQIDMARQVSRPESADYAHAEQYMQPMPMHPHPVYLQRRPSSVPPISLPTLPFLVSPQPQIAYGADLFQQGYAMGTASLHGSRAASPVGNISRSRALLGMRRASSCQPVPSERMWDGYDPHPYPQAPYGYTAMPESWQLQPDSSPLPDVTDASIFQPGWTSAFKDAAAPSADHPHPHLSPFDPAAGSLHPYAAGAPDGGPGALHINIGPLDAFDFGSAPSTAATDGYAPALTPGGSHLFDGAVDPHAPWPVAESGPSSAFSGSPARSDASLPVHGAGMQHPHSHPHTLPQHHIPLAEQGSPMVCAPQPQHAQMHFDDGAWAAEHAGGGDEMHGPHQHVQEMGNVDVPHQQQQMAMPLAFDMDGGYVEQYDVYAGAGMVGMAAAPEMNMAVVDYGYCAPQEF